MKTLNTLIKFAAMLAIVAGFSLATSMAAESAKSCKSCCKTTCSSCQKCSDGTCSSCCK